MGKRTGWCAQPILHQLRLYSLGALLALFCSAELLAQAPKLEDERPRMPYLPNAHDNALTTPAYGYARAANKVSTSSIVTTQVNVDSNQQNIVDDAANEPSLAINPLNPLQIAVGWRQFDNVLSDFRQAGNGYSTDGGVTWHVREPLEAGVFRSDPVLDYAGNGTFYYNSLTRSSILDYSSNMYVSHDGGANWGGGGSMGGGDKLWMAVDRTGGSADGQIYCAWTRLFSGCDGAFTRSVDGITWDSCHDLRSDPYHVNLTVDPWGGVIVVGNRGGNGANFCHLFKSPTAQDFGQPVVWGPRLSPDLDGYPYGSSVNPDGLMGQLNIEADASHFSRFGYIYVLQTVRRYSNNDPADVMFARSTDAGNTWDAPVRINDDTSAQHHQWFGTLSIAPNGRLDAVWYDTRDSVVSAHHSSLYYSYSMDQGQHWSPNERLSPAFDPHVGYPFQQKLGDYIDMQSTDDAAHVVWAATFTGGQDIYYSKIVPGTLTAAGTPRSTAGPIIVAYPNPTDGFVTLDNCPKGADVRVTDMLGRPVATAKATDGTATLDLGGQPAGVYVVQVAGAGSVRVVRR